MDEYIKREDVLTAFEGADADVMADYGDWAEWGFSLTKIKEVIQAVPVEYVGGTAKAFYFAYKGETRRMEPSELSDLLKSYYDGVLKKVQSGHWIWNQEYCKWVCSECGGREAECEPPFCKWCGADMREVEHGQENISK